MLIRVVHLVNSVDLVKNAGPGDPFVVKDDALYIEAYSLKHIFFVKDLRD